MTAGRLPIEGHTASMSIAVFICVLSLSLFDPLMIWVIMLSLCTLFVRISLYLGWYQHAPSQRTINLLAILTSLALTWFSFDLGLLLSMINLLVAACSLKLITLSKRKDFLQLFACGLFLIGCGFIYQQSILSALFYFATLLFLLFALLSFFTPQLAWQKRIKIISFQLLQALPIAIILFLVMPHLSPLWKMPTSQTSKTGLAEKVTPGDIANLTQSDELVFHATFDGKVPPRQDRYWRALTLEAFDGRTWEISPHRERFRQRNQRFNNVFSPLTSTPSYDYQVIAEASGRSWLYAIDIAVPATRADNEQIWVSRDYQLIANQPLMSKRAYNVKSYPAALLPSPDLALESQLNLMVPSQGNEKTRKWVTQLRQTHPDNHQFVAAVMHYFAQHPFVYTLSPPPMRQNFADTFLFDKRAGFCSHYASAMAYVLRLAGIPARMVTGYQGGERFKDQVISVYQYDAHAWVEAIVSDAGWTRYDPTAVVAPSRLNAGLREVLETSGELQQHNFFSGIGQAGVVKEIRLIVAHLNYFWGRWVLGFDHHQQVNLFTLLFGQLTPLKITFLMLGCMLAISGFLALYFLPRWKRKSIDPVTQLYLRAVQIISSAYGIARHNQPPLTFLQEAANLLPDEAKSHFYEITHTFVAYHYQYPPLDDKAFNAALSKMRKDLKALQKKVVKVPGTNRD
ncbi:DUF3488 and transglutaminase-like domain-containing protein [Alteromonas ponticola]|uniref:DUF3488 and transglutaminase-like domain-containing protein n=1 Tax=Alteromonas aquimaris TaxID=2998417 RepID=A0ABT3P7R5_9ALTE|nr:DUF3488 and transglutaminase-like domain-containing protein [Alteromonas aquimaris]MCW8108813.1 DUF3488 and transglutaminase-like domain-containing protein [Alteromonas aquimaris]